MKIDITKKDLEQLKMQLITKKRISGNDFDLVVSSMLDISGKRQAERQIKKRRNITTDTKEVLNLFCKVHREETGNKYMPEFGRDNILVNDLCKILDKLSINYEEFFRWACRVKNKELSNSNAFLSLRFLVHTYQYSLSTQVI